MNLFLMASYVQIFNSNFKFLINKVSSLQLAIGVEGGFSSGPKYDVTSEYAVVLCPDVDVKIPLGRSVFHNVFMYT